MLVVLQGRLIQIRIILHSSSSAIAARVAPASAVQLLMLLTKERKRRISTPATLQIKTGIEEAKKNKALSVATSVGSFFHRHRNRHCRCFVCFLKLRLVFRIFYLCT